MEGVSQLRVPCEILAARPEYWRTGKPAIEADTVAAAQGLLDGGATEVVVLDNHGSGNPINVSADCLPDGARLETWDVFDLPAKHIDAMLQVGYHSRGGGAGFISHTYVPGLRLRVDGELISESHGRAWAGQVPLVGIIGNDSHQRTLGSLDTTPYLAVQRTAANDRAEPVFEEAEGLEAIRVFAATAIRRAGDIPPPLLPSDAILEASMPNGAEHAEPLEAAGWERTGDVEYRARLAHWSDARNLIAAAMDAAIAPLLPHWDGATSAEQAAALDPARVQRLGTIINTWCAHEHPDWYIASAVELDVDGESGSQPVS